MGLFTAVSMDGATEQQAMMPQPLQALPGGPGGRGCGEITQGSPGRPAALLLQSRHLSEMSIIPGLGVWDAGSIENQVPGTC